jgi:uncharacterized protein YjcR
MATTRKSKRDDLLNIAIEMYRKGHSLTRIAEHLNINRKTVRRWFDQVDVKPSDQHNQWEEKEEALYQQAMEIMKYDVAEGYQYYVTEYGRMMLEESADNIAVKNVKDLDILDKIIRRNLGIEDGAQRRVSIDLSVLNG